MGGGPDPANCQALGICLYDQRMPPALAYLEFLLTLPGRIILMLYWGASGTLTAGDHEGRDSRLNRWLQTILFWVLLIPLAGLFLESWPEIRAAYTATNP